MKKAARWRLRNKKARSVAGLDVEEKELRLVRRFYVDEICVQGRREVLRHGDDRIELEHCGESPSLLPLRFSVDNRHLLRVFGIERLDIEP